MQITIFRFTLAALLVLLSGTLVQAASPATTGAHATPANAIVGTWEAAARVGPCGGALGPPFLATTVFHAGGTLTETNAAPLGGIPTPWGPSVRGPAFGTWSYDAQSDRYVAQMRFNWYVGGFYHGYQQIHLDFLELSADHSILAGTFTATRNFVNGNSPVPNCGEVEMMRFP